MGKRSNEHQPEPGWDAATWAGARREQKRRWAALPLERIVAAQEEMYELSVALGHEFGWELGRTEAEYGAAVHEPQPHYARGNSVHRIALAGCAPIPLAGYLKALGILRLVAEQIDPDARGAWQNEQFVLESHLDAEGLRRFLLHEYRPTPILAPWNGGSGFYPNDNKTGIDPIRQGAAQRLAPLRETIEKMSWMLAARGFDERPTDEDKTALLTELRAELSDESLAWLDAVVVLTEESPKYPPLLGTGGNDGRLDFTNNFMQRLVTVVDPDTGDPTASARTWLDGALFGAAQPALPRAKVGQFAPGEAGGPNQTSSFDADKPLVNPWDFTLMLEGALLFAAAATKRLESAERSGVSYPFTVRATGAGTGATAQRDENDARAELWVPLWGASASLGELRSLLGEGRVTLGRRSARDGLDFARAVARLGVERGIEAFQRYAFLMRSGRAFFATALDRVSVQRNPAADLIDELDSPASAYWLGRFRTYARRDGANRVVSLVRRLEDVLFALTTTRDDSAPNVRRLLAVLGEIQLYLARSPKARDACPPVPSLSKQWLLRADDGSAELAVAAALAGLHARRFDNSRALPMRVHLAPERPGYYPTWSTGETADHEVTWYAAATIAENLGAALGRRLHYADRHEMPDKPLLPARTAPLADIAAWLAGDLDERRAAALLPGLMLIRIPAGGARRLQRGAPLPAAYRLLKPLFCTDEQLRRMRLLQPEARLPLPGELLRRLRANDVAAALELGRRRLRTVGIGADLRAVEPGIGDGRQLLAALMVPVSDAALHSLLRLQTNTDEFAEETTENRS